MWPFFAVSMLGIVCSIILLMQRYAARSVEVVVQLACSYCWLTAMMVIALVPIDVWATRTMMSPESAHGITVLWNVAYWSTQLSTWLVIPFYEVYSTSGDFTVLNRCKTSLKQNGLIFGSIAVGGSIGIIVVLASSHLPPALLLDLAVFASNAFGLLAGLLLLGYGLVEIPRGLWLTSNPDVMLKWAAHKCGKYAEAVMRATNELETVVAVIYANQRQMRRGDPLRPLMEIIAAQAERESPIKPSEMAARNINMDVLQAEDLEYNYEEKGLAELRRRMKKAVTLYQGAQAQYNSAMWEAFEHDDVIRCRGTGVYEPPRPPGAPITFKPSDFQRFVWTYKCVARPTAKKIYACLAIAVGACILMGEMVVPVVSIDLSPFSLMLNALNAENQLLFMCLTLFPLVYMSMCCYYALFKLNAFNYNKLIEGATTGQALMQNASLMCRFAAPTCWNFYHVIRYASEYCQGSDPSCRQTSFASIMNIANIAAFKYVQVNKWLPLVLGFHVAMVALGVWDRLIAMCLPKRLRFSDSDGVDDEFTEKGRLLIRKEQDAVARGAAVGEVLHSAYSDLQFPNAPSNIGRNPTQKPSGARSLFGSLFGRGTLKPEDSAADAAAGLGGGRAGGGAGAGGGGRSTSTAASAVSRWLPGGGGAAGGGGGGGGSRGGGGPDGPSTSLLSASHTSSSASVHATGGGGGGGGGGGLDGLFADLGTRFGAPTGSGRGGGGGGRGGAAPGGARLVFGKPDDTDALLRR
ncbi:hypothetical protein FOA52_001000 [Chlamydomonas sp. UWO 241]|nr:hypothetical protein FOA52_001000 [Chlamydomonas sp. UWO 241]